MLRVTYNDALHAGILKGCAYIEGSMQAGSERAKETGTTGQQFVEGVNIIKGLLALGNVNGTLTKSA